MICKHCGSDVRPDKFCSNCGSPLNVQYCSVCGSAYAVGAPRCGSCGHPTAPVARPVKQGYAPVQPGYPPVQPGYVNVAPMDNYDIPVHAGAPVLKTRKTSGKAKRQDAAHRTGLQTLVCLLVGLASLGALGYTVYTLLMGGLFTVPVGGVYPLPVEANTETVGLVANYNAYITFYTDLVKTIQGFFGSSVNLGIAQIFAIVPGVLMVTVVPIAALMASISAFVAIFRFIVGLCSGKFFSLAAHVGWALSGLLIILLASAFAGMGGYIDMSSGLMICLIICAAALALCALSNLVFAGKRFFRLGSIMKFLSNGGILAGAIISALSLPFIFFTQEGAVGSQGILSVVAHIASENFEMPFVLYAIILAFTIIGLFALPGFVRKTSVRFAKTFKFDGYEDKGFLRKSIFNLILIAAIVAPIFMIVNGAYYDTAPEIAQGVYIFAAGGIITLVSAILNRVFLNSDQR